MQGLGRTQNMDQVIYVDKAVPGKVVGAGKGAVGRGAKVKVAPLATPPATGGFAASRKAKLDRERQSVDDATNGVSADVVVNTSLRSFPERVKEALASTEDDPKAVVSSYGNATETSPRIDRTFGVEQLTYKNMWKVLKTVVREESDSSLRRHASGDS